MKLGTFIRKAFEVQDMGASARRPVRQPSLIFNIGWLPD